MKPTDQPLSYHLLPTEDANHLAIAPSGKLDYNKTTPISKLGWKNQHIALCSTLPIKEGDYFIDGQFGDLRFATNETSKKIIADGKKIEFTTDSKLHSRTDTDCKGQCHITHGVSAIDGNTKARIIDTDVKFPKSISIYKEVNFIEEYCKRYNKKDNQKGVDVEQLASDAMPDEAGYRGFIEGFETCQALQSNAEFSLEDIENAYKMGYRGDTMEEVKNYFQSLTKSQPKGDIIIECEMEGYIPIKGYANSKQIKLDSNGQPILKFI